MLENEKKVTAAIVEKMRCWDVFNSALMQKCPIHKEPYSTTRKDDVYDIAVGDVTE